MEANMKNVIRYSIVVVVLLLGLAASLPLLAQKGGSKGPKQPPDPAIAYAACNGPWCSPQLIVMNADGSNKTTVVSKGSSAQPDWSPDGRRLVFNYTPGRNEAPGIYLVNLDGSGLCKLAELRSYGNNPVWSPVPMVDGSEWILYTDYPLSSQYTDLFAVRAKCGNSDPPVNLTTTPDVNDWYPSWSRLSNRVVVTPCGNGGCTVTIYDVSLKNGVPQLSNRITFPDLGLLEGLYPGTPSWAKDDDRLVLSAYSPATGAQSLWITDLTSSGTRQLALSQAPGDLSNPNLSPSGDDIVVWGYDPAPGIYKLTKSLDADGTEIWTTTRLADTGTFPKWRHRDP
jgi:Tol biopolymer transport system component